MVPGLKNKQMKASELRIGNLVSITYEAKKDVADTCHLDYLSELARDHFVISHFSTDEINVFIGKEIVEFSLSEIEPIPLTAEWLEKFGFSPAFHKISGEHSHLPTWYNLNGFQIDVSYFCGGENVCDYAINMNPSTELLYVHQLQNLFFALTGEELTIKS